MKNISIALFAFLLLIMSNSTFCQTSDAATTVRIDLNTTENKDISFNEIIKKYRGKVVFLDFWASWCGPCKREMPYSLKMQKYFKGKKVAFVFFSIDRNPKSWQKTIENLRITGDHYRLNKMLLRKINEQISIRYIPHYAIIDKTGKIVDADAPRPSNPQSIKEIENLLN